MSLITILIALFLERFAGTLDEMRRFRWLDAYADWMHGFLDGLGIRDGTAAFVITMLPPILLLALVALLIHGVFLGLLDIILGVFILLLCLGPKNINDQVEAYVEAGAMNDEERQLRHARELLGTEDPPAEPQERTRAVVGAIFSEANSRLFAVLIWFAVLGPLGALIYRLGDLLKAPVEGRSEGFTAAAARLQALMDWIPARLIALGYGLVGSFDAAFAVLTRALPGSWEHMGEENRQLLQDAGTEALQLDHVRGDHLDDPAELNALVERADGLIMRTLVVFLAVLALMTLAGWAG
ncbi:regulatory signaling modulator protein AmpE [Thioalkalivibrio denitrificans]|uniref:Regulatory signaling modulator protein AmpE n=1 Tax=Thioalkalivibrio denitrificans TaxID=108003 RepID=A0A1V3NCQ9_9GAMM|nr:regulatory signaling modulator protein AmpE [Thioalkalivibrio denitrificans]OOG22889.1 regulatory signaling modulator protein AmpE [Thioalkalivibrio denitrificans]